MFIFQIWSRRVQDQDSGACRGQLFPCLLWSNALTVKSFDFSWHFFTAKETATEWGCRFSVLLVASGEGKAKVWRDGTNWIDLRAFWKWSIQRAQDKLQNGPQGLFLCFQGWCAKTELSELVLCRTNPSTKKLPHRYCSACCRTQADQTLSTSQVQCRDWMKLVSWKYLETLTQKGFGLSWGRRSWWQPY